MFRGVTSKGNQTFGVIKKNYHIYGLIIPLCKTIVSPHLQNCIQAWVPYHKANIDKLAIIQIMATEPIQERLIQCDVAKPETRTFQLK